MQTNIHSKLRTMILELLLSRSLDSSICPSEVVRKIAPSHWRELMDDVREVAKIMRAEGLIEITQKGVIVTDENWKGAIRLKLKKG